MKMGTDFWQIHVLAAKQEAHSASEYARRNGLSVKSLYYWRRKLAKSDTADAPLSTGKFVALRIAPGGSNHCTLSLPTGLRLEMTALPQPEWLAALARALPGVR